MKISLSEMDPKRSEAFLTLTSHTPPKVVRPEIERYSTDFRLTQKFVQDSDNEKALFDTAARRCAASAPSRAPPPLEAER
jgi:hypothetical protein